MFFSKLHKIYREYRLKGTQSSSSCNLFSFVRYIILFRIKYGVNVEEFFSNGLYKKEYKKTDYYQNLHIVIHQWSNVKRHFCPDLSLFKSIMYRIDYLFSKVFYPGLDPMDYFRYEFFNIRHQKRDSFITEGGLKKLDKFFNGQKSQKRFVHILENKAAFNELFHDLIDRKWIITKKADYASFEVFCDGLNSVIVKPIDGGAGHGIFIAKVDDDAARREVFEKTHEKNFIIEELIKQCNELSSINPSSVNTIRVYSVVHQSKVFITGATLRMGNGDKPIDNYSAGGLAAEIETETGLVISKAVSQFGERFSVHPYTGTSIIGFHIPEWRKIKDTVTRAHSRIMELRYIGWDVVVCNDGKIRLIEANTCAGVALQQHPGLQGKKALYSSFVAKR